MTPRWGSVGHYAIGLRDGGSKWHIGTTVHRECSECRMEVEAPERAVAARNAELAAKVRELPFPYDLTIGDQAWLDRELGWEKARAAVLRLIEEVASPNREPGAL